MEKPNQSLRKPAHRHGRQAWVTLCFTLGACTLVACIAPNPTLQNKGSQESNPWVQPAQDLVTALLGSDSSPDVHDYTLTFETNHLPNLNLPFSTPQLRTMTECYFAQPEHFVVIEGDFGYIRKKATNQQLTEWAESLTHQQPRNLAVRWDKEGFYRQSGRLHQNLVRKIQGIEEVLDQLLEERRITVTPDLSVEKGCIAADKTPIDLGIVAGIIKAPYSQWESPGACGRLSEHAAIVHPSSVLPTPQPHTGQPETYVRFTTSAVDDIFPSAYVNLPLTSKNGIQPTPSYGRCEVRNGTLAQCFIEYNNQGVQPTGEIIHTGVRARGTNWNHLLGQNGSSDTLEIDFVGAHFVHLSKNEQATQNGHTISGLCEPPVQTAAFRHLQARSETESPPTELVQQLADSDNFRNTVIELAPNRTPGEPIYGEVKIDGLSEETIRGNFLKFKKYPNYYVHVPDRKVGFCMSSHKT